MDNKKYVQIFKALSDEIRLSIIKMLIDGEKCACDILKNFQITQPTLSYHMKLLCDSKLVEGRRDGAWMRYSLNKQTYKNVKEWLDIMSVDVEVKENTCCNCVKK
jgi:ArsR family transcriptional regulator